MRKIALALALILGLANGAAAQAPPPVPALPDSARLTSYSISSSTCACSVGFAIYGSGTDVDEWIQVYINGVAYLSTDPVFGWSLSSVSPGGLTGPRPITNAVLTFNAAQTGTVIIVGAERPRRLSQFSENRGVPARDLNQAVTDLTAVQREAWDKLNRAIVGQPGEVLTPLPNAASRASKVLGFDPNGQPIATTGTFQFQQLPLPFFNVTSFGALGNGINDDGPAFRAAITACQSSGLGGFAQLFIPQPPVGYLINSLDASGLGALVFGSGANSCSLVGGAVNTTGGFNGGVNIKLGNGLNRPLVYVRSGAGSPVFSNIRLDGNGVGQTGFPGGPNNRLYTIQIADGVSSPEGAIQLINSYVTNGYNGNLYQGTGRGGVFCNNGWFQFGGQATSDVNVFLAAYDDEFKGCKFGPHAGINIYIAQGSQYFFSDSAVFCGFIGEQINNGTVGYVSHVNMNYQYNSTNGVKTGGGSQVAGASLVSAHSWVNATFDGNNTNQSNNNGACTASVAGGTASDVLVNNDPFAVFIAPQFVGNEVVATNPRGKYNIEINDTSTPVSSVTVIGAAYNAASSQTAFTNNYPLLVMPQLGQMNWGSNSSFLIGSAGNANLFRLFDGGAGSVYGLGISSGSLDIVSGGKVALYAGSALAMAIDANLHVQTISGTKPTVSSCGTGATAAGSTDVAGTVTATGAAACTVIFHAAYTAVPSCVVSDVTTAAGLKVVATASQFVVTGLTSGDAFTYICMVQSGG